MRIAVPVGTCSKQGVRAITNTAFDALWALPVSVRNGRMGPV